MSKQEGINAISKAMSALPTQLSGTILKHIHSLTDYEPVIGIMGKTGAGKSSLCNALFAGEVSPVSDVAACTREPLRFRLQVGERFMTIVDLPGVGESESRDAEYAAMYRQQLPRLDLVLWLVKADDRALAVDERFYRQVIGEDHQHKVMFVISQADKIEPVSGNAEGLSMPQQVSISCKIQILNSLFAPAHPICAVSVRMQWGIAQMAERMIRCLPREASSPVVARLQQPLRTTRVKETARTDFGEAVGDVLDSVASMPFVPQIARTVIRYVRNAVVSVARSVWDFFF
ncbi:YfjP family GTPase [Citrobacter koseri]|uniref:YfjP family GTPase n=1 Tax=Citrobacter koseri TaxID=545 RepID=UPI00101FA5E1|nr:GTPase family protein [Citrobacter koseri]RZA65553.1 GTPase family protein [Citrobacter koseri]